MAHATDPPKMERNIVLKKVFYTGRTSNEFISALFRTLCYSNQDIFRFLSERKLCSNKALRFME